MSPPWGRFPTCPAPQALNWAILTVAYTLVRAAPTLVSSLGVPLLPYYVAGKGAVLET